MTLDTTGYKARMAAIVTKARNAAERQRTMTRPPGIKAYTYQVGGQTIETKMLAWEEE